MAKTFSFEDASSPVAAKTFSFEEAGNAALRDLPAGVTPSTAGAGRGNVNPPALSEAQSPPASQAKTRAQKIAELDSVTDPTDPNYLPVTSSAGAEYVPIVARGLKDTADKTKQPGFMLQPSFVADVRQSFADIAPEKRLGALQAAAKGTDVRARAAQQILLDTQAEDEKIRLNTDQPGTRAMVDLFAKGKKVEPSPRQSGAGPAAPPAPVTFPNTAPTLSDYMDRAPTEKARVQRALDLDAARRGVNTADTSIEAIADRGNAANRDLAAEDFAKKNPVQAALFSGGAQTVAGLANAVPTIVDFAARVSGLAGEENVRAPTYDWADRLAVTANSAMPETAKQPMEDAWKKGEFGEWLGLNFVAQAPNVAQNFVATVFPPLRPFVLPAMGAQTAGQAYGQGDSSTGALLKGGAEIVGEHITFGVFDRSMAALSKLPVNLQATTVQSVGKAFVATGKAVTAQTVAGAIEESATQIIQNGVDKFVEGKNTKALDGVAQAAVLGAAIEGPLAIPQAAAALKSQGRPNNISPAEDATAAARAAREQRIKTLRDAGETAAADLLQQKHDKATAAEDVEAELSRLPGNEDFANQYRTLRTSGVKPVEAASRSAIATTYKGILTDLGMSEKAITRALETAKDMPLDKVPGFLHKFADILAKQGLVPPNEALSQIAPSLEAARDDAMDAAMSSMDDVLALENANDQADIQKQSGQADQAPANQAPEAVGIDAAVAQDLPGAGDAAVQPGGVEQAAMQAVPPDAEAAPAAQAPQAAPSATEAAPVELQGKAAYLGRDNVALGEGGQAFKSRKAADQARKLNPAMRVVRADGGFALAPKTEAQLAAQEKAAKRLRNPQTTPKGEPIAAHAFIASEGGLSPSTRSDMGMEGNVQIGNRKLFAGAGRGLTIEQATERLIEEGYLQEGDSHEEARNLIKRSLTNPQYTPDGFERMAQAHAEQAFEDYLAAQEDAGPDYDPFESLGFEPEDVENSLYIASDLQTQAEVKALLEMHSDNPDIDLYSLQEESVFATQGQSQDVYNAHLKAALEAAIEKSSRDSGADSAEPAQPNKPADEPQKAKVEAQAEPPAEAKAEPTQTPAPAGVSVSENADGTVSVSGAEAVQKLKDAGVTKTIPTADGVVVGLSQTQLAKDALSERPEALIELRKRESVLKSLLECLG